MADAGELSRLARLELERLEGDLVRLERQVDAFGPVVRQVLEAELRIERATSDLEDLAGERRECEARLTARIDGVASDAREARSIAENLRADLRGYDQSRADARTRIVVAVIAGSTTVLAALAAAAAAVLSQ